MKPLSVGIVCHPGLGGSGVVATQVGAALARRGHQVHFVSTTRPTRLVDGENIHLHCARVSAYPVFETPPYPLMLASKLVEVAQAYHLDVLHAHYAIPHTTAAWMAREILGGGPKIVTTVHGTDVTLLGGEPGYLPVLRHSLQQCDAITAPSRSLRDQAQALLGQEMPIDVIPNFVDTEIFMPSSETGLPDLFGNNDPVLVHVSNFRKVKRVDVVLDVFTKILAFRPVNLLLIGDGPSRGHVEQLAATHGTRVHFAGRMDDFAPLLSRCAVFLFPSRTESFGLAALEALASGVPVVASDVGGLPELIQHGVTGYLVDPTDPDGMADAALRVIDQREMRSSAREAALAFREDTSVDAYEAVYRKVLA